MAANEQLKQFRTEIDALDDEILTLLERRAEIARAVGEAKRGANNGGGNDSDGNFHVPEREAQILHRLRENSTLLEDHITAIYREVISACLACEQPVRVAYLGPAGTYTHEAALRTYGSAAVLTPMKTIGTTIRAVEKQQCDVAVVPFENSAAGTVGATMDSLINTPLSISHEMILRIRHNLLSADAGLAAADIKHIHAHPQALEQCRRWLEDNAPQATLHAADSNAAAAEIAADNAGKAVAAIGSRIAQQTYALSLLVADIEDYANNSTRFLALQRKPAAASGRDKTSFIMTVKDEAGAMFNTLQPFADGRINMVKLESRPMPDRLWEYLFFVDLIGHRDDALIADALEQVRQRASFMKILGSYPQALP